MAKEMNKEQRLAYDKALAKIEEAGRGNSESLDLSYMRLTALPPEIGKLTNLKTLSLYGNQLAALSPEIGRLTNLQMLNFGGNQLTALPPEIFTLTKLPELYLHGNQLTTLPPEISKLINLQGLNLDGNQLAALPAEISKLTNLQTLSFDKNQLTALPPEMGNLSNLQRLGLEDNQLTALPPEMGELTNLETLELGGNPLESPPSEIVKQGTEAILAYLREKNEEERRAYDKALARIEKAARENSESLDLSSMKLTALPPEIGKLTNLKELYLYDNQLTALPPEIGKLTNLRTLNPYDNQLTALPSEIVKLKNLTELWLYNNKLTSLSAEVCQLINLTTLFLGANNLTSVPAEIGQLINLTGLYLSPNKLSSAPAEIGQLKNLTELFLGGNNMTSLPTEIGQLKRLTELYLQDNNLVSLPTEIRQLKKLKGLYLQGNDELGIPPEVLGSEYDEEEEPARPGDILEYYFRQRSEARRELREAKILLVGQGGVGKTSLVKRLIDDDYDPEELMTEGINIRDWKVAGRRRKGKKSPQIKLNVWDFGGQEIMHATHQFFLTKRSLYVLVLDARKGKNESNIQYWLKIIQSYGGDSPVLIVTNKCDGGHLDLNENRLMKDYAPNIKGFFNISCQKGDGIKELRAAIKKQINGLGHVYDEVPESYFNVKHKLEERTESEDFIDTKDFRKLCRKHKITKESEQNLLLRFLHDLGNVLNFGDPKDPYHLRDTNILNPEWVTEGVYKIINNKELMDNGGVLEWGMIGKVLNDPKRYPTERHEFIVDMMRKFELCFDFPDGHGRRVLIPELLGENEPELGWDYDKSLNFEYHYKVLPSGLICRFIVRMHHNLTKEHIYWRSGVVLAIDGNEALIRADVDKGVVFISVKGNLEGRRRALAVIRNSFDGIHATIPKLGVKQMVPLAGEEGVVVDYEHLIKLEEAGQVDYWPVGAQESYRVKDLLEGVDIQGFDVFLCHNSRDKEAVKKIGKELKARGLKVWLDEWELRPGLSWQRELEKQIESVKSAAVFVGDSGIGPWHGPEIDAFLREFVNRGCPVIPVILEDCERKPKLPVFLRGMGWVDFRKDEPDPMDQLVWGITEEKKCRNK